MPGILLFTRCMGSGGTETVILQLAEAYREAGFPLCVCAEDGPGGEKLRQMGVRFYPIPDMQSKSPRVMWTVLSTLRRIFREERVDVVHTHHRMAAFYARLLQLSGKKFVFLNNVHNTFTDKRRLTRFALGHALNIAVGDAVRENMVRDYGIPEERLRVIHNAVKAPALSDTPDPFLRKLHEEGKFLVANIGRLNTQKGMEYYIRAAELLHRRGLPIVCAIVGEGVREQALREQVSSLGLEEAVPFLGYRRDVADVIAGCDLAALSSLWEGFPLTPIEVFSVGRTIVATEVPGTLEIVRNEENGLTVPLKDPEAMADAIERLYRDGALRRRLEAGAEKTYRERFSYEAFREQYLRLLREVTKC